MSETWIKETCPNCQSSNWLNCEDTNDLTGTDVEAYCCWKCEKKFLLGLEDYEKNDEDPPDIEDVVCEWGRENPDSPWRGFSP